MDNVTGEGRAAIYLGLGIGTSWSNVTVLSTALGAAE